MRRAPISWRGMAAAALTPASRVRSRRVLLKERFDERLRDGDMGLDREFEASQHPLRRLPALALLQLWLRICSHCHSQPATAEDGRG
mmetsp:Transcript_16678/g.39264  ORF Transcript_16678/g.39264 Transcript_16678/m.39264 type:complete len:87 (+) Transcript_16678:293-553(+)